MLRRLLSLLLLTWLLGFVAFAVTLPRPAPAGRADAAIVLTGAPGRIEHALRVIERGQARKLLVSGVDRQVRVSEFERQHSVPPQLMRCCVTLGFKAYDTRSNAREAVRWLKDNRFRSVRLVTSDWHMRRARFELDRTLPRDITLVTDAVPSHPTLKILFLEYNKLLARWVYALWQR
ncbi:MAG: YdcF family protein [Novosphingobium sp.]